MDRVSDIFEALGGVTAISNGTGIPLTTVHSWKRSGFVPRWRVAVLLDRAKKMRVPLKASDIPVRPQANSQVAA
ncbi:carph-isopro domain-containing protein [Sphingomonas paucimobilis]|uniref:carph-isopro domain-containing protein n=1 Tax=Sphingomonas paucimobilis TaxID=13689 RepID=UPI00064BA96A|nr:hypothetical protein [Sphingomonas paucimobilis]